MLSDRCKSHVAVERSDLDWSQGPSGFEWIAVAIIRILKTAPPLIKRRANDGYEGPKLAITLEDVSLTPIFNIVKKCEDIDG